MKAILQSVDHLGFLQSETRPVCSVNLSLPTRRKRVITQMGPSRPDVLGMASAPSPLVSEHPLWSCWKELKEIKMRHSRVHTLSQIVVW